LDRVTRWAFAKGNWGACRLLPLIDQKLAKLSNIGRAKTCLSTMRVIRRVGAVLAWAEQLGGGPPALEEGLSKTLGQISHRLERPDEVAEPGFLALIGELDVGRSEMNTDSHISVS